MRLSLFIAPLFWLLATPLWADARGAVLVDVLKIEEVAHILQAEGIANAETLNQDMLGGKGGAGWQLQVAAIYRPERIVEMLRTRLDTELQGDQREEVIAFFASDTGAEIIALENAARAAIGDEDIETAARQRYAEIEGSDDARLAQIKALVDSGDMINRNVTAAMNSNYQFMRGLAEGGAIQMNESEMLADSAAQLDEITADTTAWLYGYLLLAYSPLENDALDQYLEFSRTNAGLALNRALFDGFGAAYEDISYALGRAVALNMVAQDL
ncbi:DUF2059 domain-containing protein [Roseobacter sp. GAI101]|uniref:DUF2059 domain-containing protein n=1 Tax=Roseobacter sp. (strain GAI101) TaxID=391589 RepID=UPI0001871BC5|nr:DUF2059 domain-containing protein [Roseobacter sp. GAI101]EEB84311.1 conserved hypothetical protein [Roseobacter sp. GAI101]